MPQTTANPLATTSHTEKQGRTKCTIQHFNLQGIQLFLLSDLQYWVCYYLCNSAGHKHMHQHLHVTRDNVIPAGNLGLCMANV